MIVEFRMSRQRNTIQYLDSYSPHVYAGHVSRHVWTENPSVAVPVSIPATVRIIKETIVGKVNVLRSSVSVRRSPWWWPDPASVAWISNNSPVIYSYRSASVASIYIWITRVNPNCIRRRARVAMPMTSSMAMPMTMSLGKPENRYQNHQHPR
ncbi:hypothetical protein [Polluticoccus soli]|uniref:hypothetical protein n=1 Tax=Polluticoccus soli TaxID=3034150 RepID=UPI0023E2CF60|nr:hypothetical protein [Flavipsychrobacter sp. JY13-12]